MLKIFLPFCSTSCYCLRAQSMSTSDKLSSYAPRDSCEYVVLKSIKSLNKIFFFFFKGETPREGDEELHALWNSYIFKNLKY